MNKFINTLLFLILFSPLTFSQSFNYEFVYKYETQTHIDKKNTKTGWAVLRANDSLTYFADQWLIKRNEITGNKQFSSQEKIKEISVLPMPVFNYEILKNDSVLTFTHKLDNTYVGFEEQILGASQWIILPQKEKFLNLSIQKAEIAFGGRQWEAWFTQDIPLNAGPYKFNGLPGLIVKIKSLDNEHIFELSEIKKTDKLIPEITFTKVSKNKYQSLRDLAPVRNMERLNQMGALSGLSVDGRPISASDFISQLKLELANANHIEKE
ncbi:GLPGLI family protein [Leadbetterella byssophila]|uniref:GLPGLI family protein n=1 Tax=Leadbetterella byssophila TaxID=316068 RepID=UPI0039A24DCC